MGALSDNEYFHFDKSVNRFGATTGDFVLELAKGNAKGHTTENTFGFRVGVSTSPTGEDITIQGGDYQFLSDLGEAIEVSSDNAADVTELLISGLDENFAEQVAIFDLQGTTPVSVPGLWTRINVGINNSNVGYLGTVDIVDAATGLKVVGRLESTEQVTQQCVYTVPAGKTAYIKLIGFSLIKGGGSDADVAFGLKTRRFGGVFITNLRAGLMTKGTSLWSQENPLPGVLPEKTDIIVNALTTTNNVSASANMQFMLVEDKFLR